MRQPVSDLLTLALLGVLLPAMAGMALALLVRLEERPGHGERGWMVLLVPVIGGGTAGLAPQLL
ncbi:hypothetical protein [Streptomyces thermospinosisporus]|uniref:hypothetical protein n=1 Tax=Streptomyces thermospinosisporus TaxID=161482 RepID=UPI0031DFDE3D